MEGALSWLKTSKQHLIWIKIKTAVNKKGPQKTSKQLKYKMQNLKDAYKAARDNNKKTGASPTYSPYFEHSIRTRSWEF